jgi:hypothetical protein
MINRSNAIAVTSALMLSTALATGAVAQNVGQPTGEAGQPNPLNNVYFGEQHLHTTASADAYIQGNHKDDVDMAFRCNWGADKDLSVRCL